MNTLYFLHLSEKAAFDRLPDTLKEGWNTEASREPLTRDTAKRQYLRPRLIRLHDPMLKKFLELAKRCKNEKELTLLLSGVELSSIHPDDLLELVFALGPDALSPIILQLLDSAKTDQDLLGIASLTFLRHELSSAVSS